MKSSLDVGKLTNATVRSTLQNFLGMMGHVPEGTPDLAVEGFREGRADLLHGHALGSELLVRYREETAGHVAEKIGVPPTASTEKALRAVQDEFGRRMTEMKAGRDVDAHVAWFRETTQAILTRTLEVALGPVEVTWAGNGPLEKLRRTA